MSAWRLRPSGLLALGPVALVALVALCLIRLAPSVPAQTLDREATEAAARRASDRMRALQQEADQLSAQEKTLLGDLRKLDVDRQIKIEQAQQLDREIAQIEAESASASARMAALEQEDVARRPELRARLVEIYKLGQGRYARLLLATTDFGRIGEAVRTVATLAKMDRDRVQAHQQTITELRSTRAALDERRSQLGTLRVEAQRAQAQVEQAVAARDAAIRGIDRQRDLNAQLTGELQSAQQRLQAALRSFAAPTPPPASAPPAAAPAATPTDLPVRPFRGDLEWPTDGAVRRRFSRPAPGQPNVASGIEIAAPEGARVVAVHEGLVAYADAFTGFGNLVILDHGAQTFSLYGNLAVIDVKKGARISAGEPLGTVGLSPAGPAGLYFELRVDGQAVDPLQWLKKR